MDPQGNVIALTVHFCFENGPCPDYLGGFLLNCRNEITRDKFNLVGREMQDGGGLATAPDATHFLMWGTGICFYGQPLDREGLPMGAKRLLYPDPCIVPAPPDFDGYGLVPDSNGSYVAAWLVRETPGRILQVLRVRKYDNLGNWLGREFLLYAEDAPEAILSRLAFSLSAMRSSENGDILFMTVHGNGNGGPGPILHSNLVVWRLNSELKRVAEPVIATTEHWMDSGSPGLGVDAQGNFVVSWGFPGAEWSPGAGPIRQRVLAQRFSRAGERVGPEILVSGEPVSQFVEFDSSQVLMRADGGFLVLWGWKRRGVIMAQRFTAAGERIGRRFQVNVSGRPPLIGAGGVTGDRKDLWAVEYLIGSDPNFLGPHTVATRIFNFTAPDFTRGDANNNDAIDLSDAIAILDYLFQAGAAPPVWQAADVNDDETVNVSDPVYLLSHLFLGGAPPPHPYPIPGFDPTG